MMIFKNNKKQKGFTLVETLVAITIFMIVIIGFYNLFISALNEQQKSLQKIHLLNNGSYLAEYFSRSLRMAVKDLDGDCVNVNMNYFLGDLVAGQYTSIRFLKRKSDVLANAICTKFYLENGVIKVSKSTDETNGHLQAGEELTPSDIVVNNLVFYDMAGVVPGDGQAGLSKDLQPTVVVEIELSILNSAIAPLQFQTTVSQRELDVPY